METRTTNIYGESNRRYIDVNISGRKIQVSYNPTNITFERGVARLMQALQGLKTVGYNFRDLPEFPNPPDMPEDADTEEYQVQLEEYQQKSSDFLDIAAPKYGGFADKVDEFADASDKIIGQGVTNAILDEDDDKLTILMQVYSPIFANYGEQRGGKTSKYMAKRKA